MALAPNLFILTGAPGSGKTAILSRLRSEFRCVDEPAREVLAEQRATGGIGTWDQDRFLFVHLLLQRSIEKYQAGRRSGRTVVFDRGIPDCVVYALRGTVALAEVSLCRTHSVGLASDDLGQLGERVSEAGIGRHVGPEIVEAPAEVLDEGMAGDDHPGGTVSLQSSHGSKPGLEPSVVGLKRVVRVDLGVMECGREQLVKHPGVGSIPVGGDLYG